MEEKLYEFISATFGISAAVAFAIIMLALWLTYFITAKVTTIKSDHNTLTKSVEKLEKNSDEIRQDLAFLKGNIEIFRSSGTNLIQSHSPLSLTEEGKKVAEMLKANDIITRNWNKIKEALSNERLDNAYDIQQYCIETSSVAPERFFDKQAIDAIKDFAYNNGAPLQLYLRVLGIIIRDRYIEERKIK